MEAGSRAGTLGLDPERNVFVIVSMEGPDRYSLAGGLGVRVSDLARALADAGYETHLVFFGDPDAPAEEEWSGVVLHRWGQWLSRMYRAGVYDGEEAKMADLARSLPRWLAEELVRPRVARGARVILMGEEWHTAPAVCEASDMLHRLGLRPHVDILWNANNPMGFERIDWPRLGFVATLTTVSRYMKHVCWERGVNPLVIPNGVPAEWLSPVDEERVARLRRHLDAEQRPLLVKVGRFDPDKRWLMAVRAVGALKRRGLRPKFLMRGGMEEHGGEVLGEVFRQGLTAVDVTAEDTSPEGCLQAIERAPDADVLHLRFFLPAPVLRVLFRGADAVLANSGMEPFGLVGLEVMAVGGVAMVGQTGEDYARSLDNAVVLDTDEPEEIVAYLELLRSHPELGNRLREGGRRTAAHYTWERVLEQLLVRLRYVRARAKAGHGHG